MRCGILLLSGLHSAYSQIPTDWENDGLVGKVKSVEESESTYSSKFETWIEDKRSKQESRNYTKDGFLVTVLDYRNDRPVWKAVWEYPKDKAQGSFYDINPKGSELTEKYVITYNSSGREIQHDVYDPAGNLRTKTIANDWSKYSWYRSGNVDEEYDEYHEGIIAKKDTSIPVEKYIWNRIDYNAEGNKVRGEEYDYDNQGKMFWQRFRHYRWGNGDTTIQYTYNDSGLTTSKKLYFDSKGRGYDYKYNQNGDVIHQEYYRITNDDPHILEETTEWDYEYDKTGNWTKSTEFSIVNQFGKIQRVPKITTYRVIKYY
ncbi:MAG: hypothetical protein ABIR47_04535 [Candidatus Kapaibacterium sp.]